MMFLSNSPPESEKEYFPKWKFFFLCCNPVLPPEMKNVLCILCNDLNKNMIVCSDKNFAVALLLHLLELTYCLLQNQTYPHMP